MLKLIVLFISIFVLFMNNLRITNALDTFFARQVIERDAQNLVNKLHHFVYKAHQDIFSLPVVEDNSCNKSIEDILNEKTFDSIFIRWIGIVKDEEIICSSSKTTPQLSKLYYNRIEDSYSIGIIDIDKPNKGEFRNDIFIIRHLNGYNYIASIQPIKPTYFIMSNCDNCLKYEVEFNSDPLFSFGYDDFEENEEVSYQLTKESSFINMNLKLMGNKKFVEQYLVLGTTLTYLLDLIIIIFALVLFSVVEGRKMSLTRIINDALNKGEFVPFYQPVMNSIDNTVVGCEVLMRWVKKDGSIVKPEQFISLAESTGLIIPMTASMLDKMFDHIKNLDREDSDLFYSINIVPQHLYCNTLYRQIEKEYHDGLFDKRKLSLEITEREPLHDIESARVMLNNFFDLGVDLKLDDAGTGYGCFSYIQNLGISTLKIDKMFIDTIEIENFDTITLDAIIKFGLESNLCIIAEGVETLKQVNYLQGKGVKLIQGYYYSQPLDAVSFFNFCRENKELNNPTLITSLGS